MKLTLYEKVMTRLQNHRLAAVAILFGTIIIALSSFTDATKNLAGLFKDEKPNPEEARIKLANMSVAYTPVEFVERAGAGDLTVVNVFLAAGMDPNTFAYEDGPTALFVAARHDRLPVVQALLKAGAKVINADSNSLVGAAGPGMSRS